MLNVVDSEWPILICVFIRCWRQHIICCAKFSIPMVAGGHTAALYLRLTSALFREKQRQMLLFERFGIFRTKWIMILEKNSVCVNRGMARCYKLSAESVWCGTSLHKFHRRLLSSAKVRLFLFPIHYTPVRTRKSVASVDLFQFQMASCQPQANVSKLKRRN